MAPKLSRGARIMRFCRAHVARFSTGTQVVGAIAASYTGVLALLYLSQIIFPGAGIRTSYQAGRTGGSVIRTEDQAVALTFTPQPGKPTIVYLHGNGDQLAWGPAELGALLSSKGLGFVGVEYPGYGIAPGSPSEININQAVDSVVSHLLATGVTSEQLVVLGQSIGCAPALTLCQRLPRARTVLISPFLSVPQMALDVYPFLRPVFWTFNWLIQDHFDNTVAARHVTNPILVLHGEQDDIVPFEHGNQLAKLLHDAHFKPIPGARHNDMLAHDVVIEAIIGFYELD